MYTVVFVRHGMFFLLPANVPLGESTWNKENRFCGWADKDRSYWGRWEWSQVCYTNLLFLLLRREAAIALKASGIEFGTLYTSVLKRAIRTADIILEGLGQRDIPTFRDWRLNERHYGALQGLNKVETAEKYGVDQVNIWRRSYNTPPPACELDSEYYPGNDKMYDCIPRDSIPNGESLELCLKRVLPYWEETIVPRMKLGKPVLVVG